MSKEKKEWKGRATAKAAVSVKESVITKEVFDGTHVLNFRGLVLSSSYILCVRRKACDSLRFVLAKSRPRIGHSCRGQPNGRFAEHRLHLHQTTLLRYNGQGWSVQLNDYIVEEQCNVSSCSYSQHFIHQKLSI